jgi:hypothetical protein
MLAELDHRTPLRIWMPDCPRHATIAARPGRLRDCSVATVLRDWRMHCEEIAPANERQDDSLSLFCYSVVARQPMLIFLVSANRGATMSGIIGSLA